MDHKIHHLSYYPKFRKIGRIEYPIEYPILDKNYHALYSVTKKEYTTDVIKIVNFVSNGLNQIILGNHLVFFLSIVIFATSQDVEIIFGFKIFS